MRLFAGRARDGMQARPAAASLEQRAAESARGGAARYFVASRRATAINGAPCSSRKRRTRQGSRLESSRSHQPIAFWMNHWRSAASRAAQPSMRSGSRSSLVHGKVKTSAARRVHKCGLAAQPSTTSSRAGSARRQRPPTLASVSATAQPSRSPMRRVTNAQTSASGAMALRARIRPATIRRSHTGSRHRRSARSSEARWPRSATVVRIAASIFGSATPQCSQDDFW